MEMFQGRAYQALSSLEHSLVSKQEAEQKLAGQLTPEEQQAEQEVVDQANAAVIDNCNQLIGIFAQLAELETPAVLAGVSDGQRLASMPGETVCRHLCAACGLVAALRVAVAWASECASIGAFVRIARQVRQWWRPHTGLTWALLAAVVIVAFAMAALCVAAPLFPAVNRVLGVIGALAIVIGVAGVLVSAIIADNAQRRSSVRDAIGQLRGSARAAGQLAGQMRGAAMGRFQQLFEGIQQKLDAGVQQVNSIVGPIML